MDTLERETFFITSTENPFSKTLYINPHKEYTHICVLHAAIPKSYYMLPEAATLTLSEPNGTTFNLTFPQGNYISIDVKNELSTQLNNNLTYTYTVNGPFDESFANNGKFKITVSNNNGDQPTLTVSSIYLAAILGFSKANYNYTFSSNILESEQQVNYQRYYSLALMSNIVEKDIFLIINTHANPYNSTIIHETQDIFTHSKPLIRHQSNNYTFRIVNAFDFSETIDFQSYPISFEIMVWRLGNPSQILSAYIYYKYRQDQWRRQQWLQQPTIPLLDNQNKNKSKPQDSAKPTKKRKIKT